MSKPRKTRYDKVARAIDGMMASPGQWTLYKAGQTQHQAHAFASWLRRKHPAAEWIAQKHGEGYATFGRILLEQSTAS